MAGRCWTIGIRVLFRRKNPPNTILDNSVAVVLGSFPLNGRSGDKGRREAPCFSIQSRFQFLILIAVILGLKEQMADIGGKYFHGRGQTSIRFQQSNIDGYWLVDWYLINLWSRLMAILMDNIFTGLVPGRPQLNSDPIAPPRLKAVQIPFHTKIKLNQYVIKLPPKYCRKGFHGKSFNVLYRASPSREVLGVQTLQVSCTQRQSKPPKYLLSFGIRTNTLYNLD